jgi:hypothetical protein
MLLEQETLKVVGLGQIESLLVGGYLQVSTAYGTIPSIQSLTCEFAVGQDLRDQDTCDSMPSKSIDDTLGRCFVRN